MLLDYYFVKKNSLGGDMHSHERLIVETIDVFETQLLFETWLALQVL